MNRDSDGASSAASTAYGPFPSKIRRRHRISILKKLREKFDATSLASSSSSASVGRRRHPLTNVVKVNGDASVSSRSSSVLRGPSRYFPNESATAVSYVVNHSNAPTVSSGSLSSTLRSWRLVDDFLTSRGRWRNKRGGARADDSDATIRTGGVAASTRSGSALSGKTIIYDDRAFNVDKPPFCTIVNVETSTAPSDTTANLSGRRAGDNVNQSASPLQILVRPDDDDISVEEGLRRVVAPDDVGGDRQRRRRGDVSGDAVNGVRLTGWRSRADSLRTVPPAADRIVAASCGPVANFRLVPEMDAEPSATESIFASPSPNGRAADESASACLNALSADDLPRMFDGPWLTPPAMGALAGNLEEEETPREPKGCCGSGRVSHSLLIRIFIAIISLIGLSCVMVGIVLGALTVSGSTRLTLCLLMIGVGIVLMIVSCIAWRLTSVDPAISMSCCGLLGFRSVWRNQSMVSEHNQYRATYYRVRHNRRSTPPFINVLPPEFVWRPPPPTYQATVQEMRLQNIFGGRLQNMMSETPAGLPPPSYRIEGELSGAEIPQRPSLVEFVNRNSRPPSYSTNNAGLQATENTVHISNPNLAGNRPVSGQVAQARNSSTTELPNIIVPNSLNNRQNSSTTNHNNTDDDRADLLRHDHLSQQNTLCYHRNPACDQSNETLNGSQVNDRDQDTTSVIDCSEAIPVVKRGSIKSAKADPRSSNHISTANGSRDNVSSNDRDRSSHERNQVASHGSTSEAQARSVNNMQQRRSRLFHPAPPIGRFNNPAYLRMMVPSNPRFNGHSGGLTFDPGDPGEPTADIGRPFTRCPAADPWRGPAEDLRGPPMGIRPPWFNRSVNGEPLHLTPCARFAGPRPIGRRSGRFHAPPAINLDPRRASVCTEGLRDRAVARPSYV